MLRHPLVYQVPYAEEMAAWCNEMFRRKTEKLKQLIDAGNADKALALYERPYRLQALIDLGALMDDKTFWESAGWVWADTENAAECWDEWQALMRCGRPSRQHLMSPEERLALEAFPGRLTVWRGQTKGQEIRNFSWTKSRQVAEWFAGRFNNKDGVVIEGSVDKAHVIAYITSRGEEEILVFPEDVLISA